MALNSCEMWSNGIKIAFFSKNLQKSPSGWGLCPQTPIAIGGWGLCPQTPVSDTFEYTSLLNTSSKLDFYTFQQLVFALSLYQNPGKVPSGYGFRSSILRYLCPTKNYFFEKFWWRHCVWFVVWAPPIKNPGYAYAWHPNFRGGKYPPLPTATDHQYPLSTQTLQILPLL